MSVKDSGNFKKRLNETKKKYQSATVQVGFLENATYPDGTSVAYIASVQEYGTSNIPARPFFRNAISENRKDWKKKYASLLKKTDFDVATKTLAEVIVGDIKQSITTLDSPPLAKSTIKQKGFSKPLIDTGHMLNSVDYRIIKKKS